MADYSQIRIKFNDDPPLGNVISIGVFNNQTNTFNVLGLFLFVVNRSGSLQITQGNPTANNFKNAFDIDYPSGYITSITDVNEITIISQNQDIDFFGVFCWRYKYYTAS